MSIVCPYCASRVTSTYYETEYPLFTWPLPDGVENPSIRTEVALCLNCFYAFNATPPDEATLDRLYSNYLYVKPSQGIGASSHEGFIKMVSEELDKDENIVEIGCSDGYLLLSLHQRGFRKLSGMDPSPHVPEDFPVPIKKAYFTRQTRFEEPVDAFLMEHVFEHLPRPWEFLQSMTAVLPEGGRIALEVPHYTNGMHHQHLSFFTPIFFQTIASESGLEILSYHEGNVSRVLLKKTSSPKPFFASSQIEEKKRECIERTKELQQKEKTKKTCLAEFVQEAGETSLWWWGTGSTSASLYLSLPLSLRQRIRMNVVDSDKEREGLIFTPSGSRVMWAHEVLKDRTLPCLVLAAEFSGEMKALMGRLNCKAEALFTL